MHEKEGEDGAADEEGSELCCAHCDPQEKRSGDV